MASGSAGTQGVPVCSGRDRRCFPAQGMCADQESAHRPILVMVGCPIPAGWMDARQLCGDDGAAAFECLCREALVPVCIGQSKADPEFGGKLPSRLNSTGCD